MTVKITDSNIVDNIDISLEQLLALRHFTITSSRNTPVSNSTWLGNFRSNRRGHGSDYDDLRQYSTGDDIRHIDWRASARMQQLHTRLYREEQQHRTTLVCDLRQSMYTGSDCLRANRAIQLTAHLLWQIYRKGTKLNILIISTTGVYHVESGAAEITAIRGCTALAKVHEHTVNILRSFDSSKSTPHPTPDRALPLSGSSADPVQFATGMKTRYHELDCAGLFSGPSLGSVLSFLVARLEHKSTIVWISGMDNAGDQLYTLLGSTGRQSTHSFIYINEPLLEKSFPQGEYHYRQHSVTQNSEKTVIQSTTLNRNNRKTLQTRLAQMQQDRIQQFDALMIPYLTSAVGNTELIAALQHQGIIA